MSTPADQDLLSPERISVVRDRALELFAQFKSEFFNLDAGMEASAIVVCLAVGFLVGKPLTNLLDRLTELPLMRQFKATGSRFGNTIAGVSVAFLLLSTTRFAFDAFGISSLLLTAAISLSGAWVVIRVLTAFIAERFWARIVANTTWTIAALNILGLLEPLMAFLDGPGFSIGNDTRVSPLTVMQGIIILAALYWLAQRLSKILTNRVNTVPNLTPSARLLISKSLQITLLAIAVLASLQIAGINLGALAIFSGAVGLGIGFGLQKIFSNLISGIILLMDRSVKPGDVVSLDETYGHINALSMRFTSVITRDGMEHLIPNEDFITTKVINWSYSDRAVRIKRMIGVDYSTDIPKAMEIIVEAAGTVERVLERPATKCLLRGFGDNSIDLEVRFWVADPENGVNNVSSEVLLAIWKAFTENDIAFPYPQRDIHFKGGDPVRVQIEPND